MFAIANQIRMQNIKAELEARRPTKRGEAGMNSILNVSNWKQQTALTFVTYDKSLADEVAAACRWFLGGCDEYSERSNGRILYSVWSKGYYHHIGA